MDQDQHPQSASAGKGFSRAVWGFLCGAALVLSPEAAWAQRTAALDRFEPSPVSDLLFAVPSADVPGRFQAAAAVGWSFAVAPLLAEAGGQDVEVVSHQVTMHVQGSLELARRVKLDADLPFTPAERGQAGNGFQAPEGASLNDFRLGMRVLLMRPRGARPGASLAFSMWAPTGNEHNYAGSGVFRYAPSLVIGGDVSSVFWSASLGRRFQPGSDGGALLGSEILFGAGAMVRLGDGGIGLGPEVFGTTVAGAGTDAFAKRTSSLEAGLTARFVIGAAAIRLGFSGGLVRGIGTPALRVVAGLDYRAPEPSFAAHFGDALEVNEAGSARASAGRPVKASAQGGAKAAGQGERKSAVIIDADGDGVADAQDACPSVAGVLDANPKRSGCPADRDGDGVADVDDRCPDVAGESHADSSKHGCPRDTDGDGIVDSADACPADKGVSTADSKTNGCPATVRLEGTQIVLLQQIRFVEGSNELAGDSAGILEDVMHVMGEHPEIARVAVDGHTDNVGSEAANIELSQRRAVAVARWLIQHGIDARRIETRGFGPRRPIAANDTEQGRAQNRRVEFQIRKRSPNGEAGWRDGPID